MKRTLGTISTQKGTARIEHNSATAELRAVYSDGTAENVGDYYPTKSWMMARKQVKAMYENAVAYHDAWVLCLRPVRSLQVSRSEAYQWQDSGVSDVLQPTIGSGEKS